MRRNFIVQAGSFIAATILAAGGAPAVFAQTDYPSRPVHLVVPFAPGGVADFLGRTFAKELEPALKVPVVVENRAGAASNIGAEYVAQAKPDGYTVILAPSNVVVNMFLYKNYKLNAAQDFTPVALVATVPSMLVVHPSIEAGSVAELIKALKAKPASMTYASSGEGSPAHLAAVQFQMLTGTSITHVPYGRGAGAATVDLLSGRVSMMFGPVTAFASHIKAGTLRPLTVTGANRLPAFPNVPTIGEAGVANFEHDSWYGILAPKGTPAAVVTRLNAEVQKVLAQAEIQEKMLANGTYPAPGSASDFGSRINAEIPKYRDFIKRANIAAQ